MMCGWTDAWEDDTHARGIIGYFLSASHRKQIGERYVETVRDPLPELLIGDPEQMAGFLRHQRIKKKFSILVVTFEKDDVSTTDFNLGVGSARRDVGRALSLILEIAYTGIPPEARPPVLVGTHTHTGRLELNCVLPRAVLAGHGRWLGFNPKPPRALFDTLWDTTVQCLNARFGWADPSDPQRARLVKLPDWRLKQKAEAERNGITLEDGPGERIAEKAEYLASRLILFDRADLLSHMKRWLDEEKISIKRLGPRYTVFEIKSDRQCASVKLGGLLFSAGVYPDFSGDRPCPDIPQLLRNANKKIAKASAINIEKYGKKKWPNPGFDLEAFFEEPPVPLSPKNLRLLWRQNAGKYRYSKSVLTLKLEVLLLKCARWIEEAHIAKSLSQALNSGPLKYLKIAKKKWDSFYEKYDRRAAGAVAGCLSEIANIDRQSGGAAGGARGQHIERAASRNDRNYDADFRAVWRAAAALGAGDETRSTARETRRSDGADAQVSERPERLSFERPERGSRGWMIRSNMQCLRRAQVSQDIRVVN